MNARLKAYEVRDNYEGHATVIFSTNSAAARREGASDLGIDWEDVEHCRRAPHLDEYAPGPVSPLILLLHGWWFECQHCGKRVTDDADDETGEQAPREAGRNGVYCSEGCECADHMEMRGRDEAAEALREVFEAKFPNATITHIHVYGGPRLEAGEQGRYVVTFTFPSATYNSRWEFGDEFCRVPLADVDAFNAWRNRSKA